MKTKNDIKTKRKKPSVGVDSTLKASTATTHLARGQEITVTIEKINAYGVGEAYFEGIRIRVPATAEQEVVTVEIEEKFSGGFWAKVKSIKKPHPERVPAPCPYFNECGGCDFQFLSYPEQLRYKNNEIRNLAKYLGVQDVCIKDVLPSPDIYGYRNRLSLQSDGNKIGFYAKKSHELVAIKNCLLASDALQIKIAEQIKSGAPMGRVDVRENDSSGFIQVNTGQNTQLQKWMIEQASFKKRDHVLELYCGAGNFTFHIADKVQSVVAVEGDSQSVETARKVQKKLDKKNIQFIVSDVLETLHDFATQMKLFDVIVCDPPRSGLKSSVGAILRLKPKKIIYISCDRQTFCEDVKKLMSAGYELKVLQGVDMFPQTRHIEVASVLELKNKRAI